MSWLSRVRRSPSRTVAAAAQTEAVSRFWGWWSDGGAAAVSAAIEQRRPEQMVELLAPQITAVNERLAWELGQGSTSAHLLVVTSGGDPAVRGLARRWLRAAPPSDLTWQFADARQPSADLDGVELELSGTRIDAGTVQVSARVRGAEVDVSLFHPAFARFDERQRATATYLLLDQAVGENAVETWVGAVTAITAAPLDPISLRGLRAVVRQLSEQHTLTDGEPTWNLLSGQTPQGQPVLAAAQVPLKAATAPHLDTHVRVVVPYRDRTEAGLAGEGSLAALRSFEDHLNARLEGSGRIVAHESCDGVRQLHLYVDGTTPAAEQVRVAAAGWHQGRVDVVVTHDPGWDGVAHLRA
jgi:hypothetical protein